MYFIRISASSFYKQIQKITRKTDITYIPIYTYNINRCRPNLSKNRDQIVIDNWIERRRK